MVRLGSIVVVGPRTDGLFDNEETWMPEPEVRERLEYAPVTLRVSVEEEEEGGAVGWRRPPEKAMPFGICVMV